MNTPSPRLARGGYAAVAGFIAVIWLAVLPARPLFNPDEGRYAEIPREMLSGGDWVVPHLDGVAYIEKPPLQYWATALSLRLFGQNEFAARLYTALCALGTLGVVWLLAESLWDAAVAWRAAASLASLLLFVAMGQLLTLDMSLTFYMTLALAGFLLAQPRRGEGRPPQRAGATRRWMAVAWAATALGVLTKGLVAAAVPAAALVLYSLYARDGSPWRRLHAPVGLPLFLAISVPWHWLAAQRLSDFLSFFFVHEHLARYLTPSADRQEPWWFFAAVFVVGSAPWTVPAIRVLLTGWRRSSPGSFDPRLFLWVWTVFVGVFFSLSDSKLIPYILPLMPTLALLIAASPAERVRRDVARTAVLTLAVAAGLAAFCVWAPHHLAPTARNGYFLKLAAPLRQIALLLGLSGLLVMVQRERDITRAAVTLSAGWCLAALLLLRAAALVAPLYSGVGLARSLGIVPPGIPVYSVATYDQSLPFYSQHTVKLVAYRGELDYGLRREPTAEIPSVADFIGQWQDLTDGYAVMEISMLDDLKSRGVPLREMSRTGNRVLVARR